MTILNRSFRASGLFVFLGLFLFAATEKSEAAGLLQAKNNPGKSLTLQDHHVSVVVENGYAVTSIEQIFANRHTSDMEAMYSFPVPEKAAVAEFTYWIDGKPVSGEVLPKSQARAVYEDEKLAGRETALAEENPARSFTMSVYPVLAGKDVRTRLRYIQPVHLDTGMGRYLYPLEDGGVDDQALNFWTRNDKVEGNFSFTMTLRTDYPIDAIRLPGHPHAHIARNKDENWTIRIDGNGAEETNPAVMNLDRDIIVNWRSQPDQPGRIGLSTYKNGPNDTGTFMLTINPGIDLKPIPSGRDWIFVLDKSGSMQGKYTALLHAVEKGLEKLPADDRLKVMVFDNQVHPLTRQFLDVNPANINKILNSLHKTEPDNGTNLHAALSAAMAETTDDRPTGIILITDGVANVGATEKQAFFDLVKNHDIRLFTMIMGNSANTPLLVPMTEYSGGTAIALSNTDDMAGAILAATSKLSHEALHDVSVTIDGVKTGDINPAFIPSLYRGQQLILTGHYWGSGEAIVRFKTKISGKDHLYESRFTFPETDLANPELERLWAFATIEGMLREMEAIGADADADKAITDIAMEYSLVTPWTSMVVVRDEVFKKLGISRQNRDRIDQEQKATAMRQANTSPAQQTHTPFAGNQPGYQSTQGGNGSGAMSIIDLLLLALGLTGIIVAARQKQLS